MWMRTNLGAICCTVIALISISSGSRAQTSSEVEAVRSYMGIGRIEWRLPKSFDHYFAVPEFTTGPRIKCKGPNQDCQITVVSRDITVSLEQRRAELASQVAPYLQRSEEKTVQPRSFGIRPEVVYVTFKDSRPKAGEFSLYTTGFSVNGPAVIKFEHFSNDARGLRQILEVVQSANTIDALEVWAWRLNDYRIVCEERFPAYKTTNNAAYQSSPFSSVDVLRFWQAAASLKDIAQVPKDLEAGRLSYARTFDDMPLAQRQRFCEGFPTSVKAAGEDVSTK
jgi:hypothetical protein